MSRPRWKFIATATCMVAVAACARARSAPQATRYEPEPGERHLANIRQLTFGGQNAEAYWSADGKRLIFQSQREGRTCDQEFVMDADCSSMRLTSSPAQNI